MTEQTAIYILLALAAGAGMMLWLGPRLVRQAQTTIGPAALSAGTMVAFHAELDLRDKLRAAATQASADADAQEKKVQTLLAQVQAAAVAAGAAASTQPPSP